MINKKMENFLEKTDMNYLFCLLAKLEAQRISQLPTYVRQRFPEKIPIMAMDHVADNEVPDYIAEIAEAELAMAQQGNPFQEDDMEGELAEEIFDDSEKFIEPEHDNLDKYPDEDSEEDEEFGLGDDEVEDDE